MNQPPYITAGIDGIGGSIKAEPDHFRVEELPLYEPSGQGPHVYCRLERTGMNTREVVEGLARLFDLREIDVGCAGQKDKNARTIQTFSINLPAVSEKEAADRIAAGLPVVVRGVARHRNKLKTGHLLGNRFTILLTGVEPETLQQAETIAAALAEKGLPNFFGAQRFGQEGDNAERGLEVLLGRGPRKKWLRRFLLSAWQSERFNRWLALRIENGWFDRIMAGDMAKKTDTGGMFLVEDEAAETPRFEAREITYTGPMFGAKMKGAQGLPGELEQQVLDESGVDGPTLKKARLDGGRRPARLFLPPVNVAARPEGLAFDFALPKGSYATIVMREFMKTEPGPDLDAGEEED